MATMPLSQEDLFIDLDKDLHDSKINLVIMLSIKKT